jgi:hypothetical protein
MAFTGPYPTVFSGHTTAMVISATTFSSGVTNTGTIGPGGISVVSGAFLSGGGILDTGTIAGGIKVDSSSKIVASGGTTRTAIAVKNTPTFGGGISNAGLISATSDGILAASISIFSGGIRNNGTIIAASTHAIVVSNVTAFAGGITNSGQISGGGRTGAIFVSDVTRFAGGILNASAGVISATLHSQRLRPPGRSRQQRNDQGGALRNPYFCRDGHGRRAQSRYDLITAQNRHPG